jgi:hypothetical protein
LLSNTIEVTNWKNIQLVIYAVFGSMQLDELYKNVDVNKDGKVNADELATLLTQNTTR